MGRYRPVTGLLYFFLLNTVTGTALEVGRSRVRFPMVSLVFFIDLILPAAESTQPLTEMSARNIFWGVKVAGT